MREGRKAYGVMAQDAYRTGMVQCSCTKQPSWAEELAICVWSSAFKIGAAACLAKLRHLAREFLIRQLLGSFSV